MTTTTFSFTTNKSYTQKLESSLIYTVWKQGRARGGAPIEIEVRTSFVGEGAQISIKVMGSSSKKITSFNDYIFGNRYRVAIILPPNLNVGEELWFDVKLSKQKLKGSSNRIPAFPMPQLLSMGWNQEIVREGDVVSFTAQFDRVQKHEPVIIHIYEYDRDGIHDLIAQIPAILKDGKLELLWQFEYHEDTNEIPTQTELNQYGKSYNPSEYFFVVDIDGLRFGDKQESGLLGYRRALSLVVCDSYQMPIKNQHVNVHIPDGSIEELISDDEGLVQIDEVVPGALYVEMVEE